MIDTQFSRRNLDALDRILLAQKKAPILERLARKKQVEAGGDRKSEAYKEIAFVQMDKSDLEEKAIHPVKPIPPTETKPEPKEPPKPIHVHKKALVMSYRGLSFYRHIIPIQACKGIQGRYQCNVWAFCGCNKKAENVQ